MIISASRRCDIPNYHSAWFFNELKKRTMVVKHTPFLNKRIVITPENVDCIVFWTKNPEPMMSRLNELEGYAYYFQFTLTGYSKRIEPGVPDKHHMIEVFQRLSQMTSRQQVIWRYDPIFLSPAYSVEYHKKAFRQIAEALGGYTDRCVISFVDIYGKLKERLTSLQIREPNIGEIMELAAFISETAAKHGMQVESCAERIDLSAYNIHPTHCIDAKLIEQITDKTLNVTKDLSQRQACGCCSGVDIGSYHQCKNGCVYCYAN
ncbi:DUF1848 domain-containing protein [Clostridium porci]|nr:DUF1848 domain-containing protein [Clostridium porci]